MTFSKYLITNFLKSVKIYNGAQSLAYANSESQLIHEGLKLLGYSNHEYVEEIDDLKSVYWEIKDKYAELEGLKKEETKLEEQLEEIIGNSSQKEQDNNDQVLLIQEEHRNLLREQQNLSIARDGVEKEGRRLLKIHQGLKAKKQHIADDGAAELDSRTRACLQKLKGLKTERDKITAKEAALVEAIEQKKSLIHEAKRINKRKSALQTSISTSNRNLSNNRIEQKKRYVRLDELYFLTGEYLVENQKDREVRYCIKSNKRILAHLKALAKSVKYHRMLGQR